MEDENSDPIQIIYAADATIYLSFCITFQTKCFDYPTL